MPQRGEVWLVDLNPVRGHEQGWQRPALILSNDQFNNGPAGLVVVVPLTTTERPKMPLRVRIDPPEGGLRKTSFALCEAVRSISTNRLLGEAALGTISSRSLASVVYRVRALLDL
jgi:mRNA interferase MazF